MKHAAISLRVYVIWHVTIRISVGHISEDGTAVSFGPYVISSYARVSPNLLCVLILPHFLTHTYVATYRSPLQVRFSCFLMCNNATGFWVEKRILYHWRYLKKAGDQGLYRKDSFSGRHRIKQTLGSSQLQDLTNLADYPRIDFC